MSTGRPPWHAPDPETSGEIIIADEHGAVRVRKVKTRNGERLELHSLEHGRSVRLDALALESLTWQTMDTFSAFLRDPFGPSSDA